MRPGSKLSKKGRVSAGTGSGEGSISKPPSGSSEGSNPACSSSESRPKQASIQTFFSTQVKREEKTVPCPICNEQVLYKSINQHLDSCTGSTSEETTQSKTCFENKQTLSNSIVVDQTINVDSETIEIIGEYTQLENQITKSALIDDNSLNSSSNTSISSKSSSITPSFLKSSSKTPLKSSSNTCLSLKSSSNTSLKSSSMSIVTTVDDADNDDHPIVVLNSQESSKDECNEFESENCTRKNLKRGISDSDPQSPLLSQQSKPQFKKLKTEDEFSDEEDNGFATLCLDSQVKVEAFKSPVKSSQNRSDVNTQDKIKLSPSISYNPARYGGINAISKEGIQFVRTSYKTAAAKFGSPRKRRSGPGSGGQVSLPDMPQHDPYTPSKRQDAEYVPYYVVNFEYIVDCVIDCTDDGDLFNKDELKMIETYRDLPLSARKLYVRLFNRKHAWILQDKLKYDECPNIQDSAQHLINARLLQNKESLEELDECLNILVTADVKLLAKEFNVNNKVSNKQDIIQELKKMCEKKSIFQTKSTLKDKVVKRGRSLVGSCYKLHPESRSVLNRVLCLWGVSQWWGERENDRPPNSLTTLLLANQGRLVFPQYSILRERKIFRGREDLIACEVAMKLVDKLETALNNKDFDAGHIVYLQIKTEYKKLQNDADLTDFIEGLPVFLRKLTLPSFFLYGLSRSVELLEKMKDYSAAVELLKLLLETDFIFRYRGAWYERLCLDLETHLKKPGDSLNYIEMALNDNRVRGARRLALYHRITKICTSKRNLSEFGSRLQEFTERSDWQDHTSQDLPTVVISGRMVSKDGLTNTKSIFMLVKNGETTYCNVEELVRDHYKDLGLYEGCHAEGSLLNSILTLLFWDIIYHSQVPDAFRDPAQSSPLDWDTDDFYNSRKDLIDNRLKQISEMSKEELADEVEDYFSTHLNVSSLVNWDLFRSQEYIRGLIMCFEPQQLTKILERMIKDHRTYRSGLPDLTCWNPETQELRFVEVKGPGDKLSYKQILWIRFFISIGVTAEVCHVDPTGSVNSNGAGGAAKRKLLQSPAKKSPQKTPVKKKPQRASIKKKPQNNPTHTESPISSMKGKPLIDSNDLCSDAKLSKLKKRRLTKKGV